MGLGDLPSGVQHHAMPGSISPRVRRALACIHADLARPPGLKDVAAMLGIHPVSLCRLFKKEVGMTFREYALRVRIRSAVRRLIGSESSIKEISYDLGFRRPAVFSKAFKRLMGCCPKTYRIRHALAQEAFDSSVIRDGNIPVLRALTKERFKE